MLLAMASETEKAHALLQSFSTASIISSLGLGIFCFVADRLLQFSFIQQNDWLRALSDNTVHGVVGLWSWAIVIGLKKKSDLTEVLLAGFLSSVIDMDHFVLAGSFSLKVSCLDSSTKTIPSLFHCDSCCVSDVKIYYASFQAEGFLVLSSLDAVYLLDFASCSGWNSSWPVDLSIWKDFSPALLALCGNHSLFTSSLFFYYVFNRNKRTDVDKTWDSYRCLRTL
ncbi:hypothetical protein JD844_008490 [Phrynosoma platyrhinos]|uniref:Transmembrane protein 267 n=1 Tax=Phrynosoma platyrhinos TaxID=52577 RepID=A0ABQ7TEJ5_PHRPL|nr:hypothetical protein JD844_008490 [Phrynosoma platyrhinos]